VPPTSPLAAGQPPITATALPAPGATTATTATTAPTGTPAVPDQPHTYGSSGAPGRIVVKATSTAWVQVYDGNQTILTRTLKAGDVYYPPAKEGLILRTGSAGGLEFTVDGKTLPSLGPVGMVKKRIPLDPERLLSGQIE
jgi:cytoskeleton protein RodZ